MDIVAGIIYRAIVKATGEEVSVSLVGGREPEMREVRDGRTFYLRELDIIEAVGDAMPEWPDA